MLGHIINTTTLFLLKKKKTYKKMLKSNQLAKLGRDNYTYTHMEVTNKE